MNTTHHFILEGVNGKVLPSKVDFTLSESWVHTSQNPCDKLLSEMLIS